jgi:hypothetical protein
MKVAWPICTTCGGWHCWSWAMLANLSRLGLLLCEC